MQRMLACSWFLENMECKYSLWIIYLLLSHLENCIMCISMTDAAKWRSDKLWQVPPPRSFTVWNSLALGENTCCLLLKFFCWCWCLQHFWSQTKIPVILRGAPIRAAPLGPTCSDGEAELCQILQAIILCYIRRNHITECRHFKGDID